ncbi:hypothetical protein GQ53DRAFT_771532 [Thozetella sp. PMI_491]|nr:hypothetical protein GQ53DRAFT_771532 [Thozetella sp. PMI_491]
MAPSGPVIIYANQKPDLSIWFKKKELFHRLYIEENHTLKKVKEIMETVHGFPETKLTLYERILRDELGLRKNLKAKEWTAIDAHQRKRQDEGKEAGEVLLDGRQIPSQRVKKETRRNRKGTGMASILLKIQGRVTYSALMSSRSCDRHASQFTSHFELRTNSPWLKFCLLFRDLWPYC